ncbi:hypothetical protein ACFQU1_22085 [Chelatococcus sp. GCM10030263]|uniref:hypothetical protein n=1 Tax=Chelatococcus sp. GCM10030263 TaxID=3273387 RepID=UPI003605CA17
MLKKLSQFVVAAGLVLGAAVAVTPASAAPAGPVVFVPPHATVTKVQYRPRHYAPAPRRVCRWQTVRVRGAYGRWVTKRVQRCVVRR